MKLRSDNSGQVMLATAFLLAIVLTFIALMLNNVVYYNNISYTGLMDQGYDDVSIKNIVVKEAIYAYNEFHDDQTSFNKQMQDLANSLNNGTLPEGSYVVISSPTIYAPYVAAGTYQSTEFQLTIYSKGLSKTYTIKTKYSPPVPTPLPTPAPTVLNCQVTILSPGNNSIIYQGPTNHTSILIKAIDKDTGDPAVGQEIDLKHNGSAGIFYFDPALTSDVNIGTSQIITGDDGTIILYWSPFPGVDKQGIDIINASVGATPSRAAGNWSNNVFVTNKIYVPCDHVVTIGGPTLTDSGTKSNQHYVVLSFPITVPATPAYNFSSFTVGSIYNPLNSVNIDVTKITFATSGNFTAPDYVKGPGAYAGNIDVKLYLTDKNIHPYTANITVTVTAYCNRHFLPYSTKSTYLFSGTWT